MKKIFTLLTLCLAGALSSLAADPRPNILFIMADDHAANAISAYGSKINQTPNLDRIAREGERFDHCFCVNSICTPSRATILTGKYSHINGVPVFNRFDGSQPTVAKYLQAAGYYTGMIGKWHLGSDPTGFDYWRVLPGQGVYHNPIFLTPEGRTKMTGYATDIITDLSLDFLKNRPKDKPFFLMCHHKAPHRPWEPDDKHAMMYENEDIPEPATFNDNNSNYATRSDAAREATMRIDKNLTATDLKMEPPPGLEAKALKHWKYERYIKDYLRCIASVDDNVGRLLDYLDQSGLRENTLVIYTSDQGFYLGDHDWFDKRFMYEQALQMPFLVRWPGVIKPGSTEQAMALNVDFAPTFMQVAGLAVPGDMQGHSLMPLLHAEHPAGWQKSMYYRYYDYPGAHKVQPHYGVRTETHKLIYFWKINQWECYDLIKDPSELRNIYGDPKQAKTVAALKKELYRLKAEVRDEDQFADKLPDNGVDLPQPKARQKPAAE